MLQYCTCMSKLFHLQEIYKRIEQLKFNDCHAKILQVDSQFTIGDSVIVQVLITVFIMHAIIHTINLIYFKINLHM